jgi:hypothetical protein
VLSGMKESKESFITRVSQMPVVNSTIRTISDAYSNSKEASSMLKYSAETVESGMRSLIDGTRPVLDRLEPQLDRLDDFACRQLDKLEKSYPVLQHGFGISQLNSLVGAESVRTLQYCLQWLQYATTHIEQQISLLREGMTAALVQQRVGQSLVELAAHVKREVVETLRKVVEVISKYAGNALPFEARNLVRNLILSLPSRWHAISAALNSSTQPGSQGMAEQEANRVLTLAQESNAMLRNTMAVFGQTVTSEAWQQSPVVAPIPSDMEQR